MHISHVGSGKSDEIDFSSLLTIDFKAYKYITLQIDLTKWRVKTVSQLRVGIYTKLGYNYYTDLV